MATKYRVQIALDKISKDRINTFDRKDGSKGKTYEADLIILDGEPEVIFENDKFTKTKVGFLAEPTKKEDPSIYVGEAYNFVTKEEGSTPSAAKEQADLDELDF